MGHVVPGSAPVSKGMSQYLSQGSESVPVIDGSCCANGLSQGSESVPITVSHAMLGSAPRV
jgi:hypothetical protein